MTVSNWGFFFSFTGPASTKCLQTFSTEKAQHYSTRRKSGIWWSCVEEADSLDIDILRNGSLSASITRHASDFVLAQRWTTLHILGDMKPSPWIFRRSTNFLQEGIKKSNNFFFQIGILLWPSSKLGPPYVLVVVFLLVPCQLVMYSNPSSGNVCKSLHLPLNGRNHNPSVCSSVRPEAPSGVRVA